MSTPRASPLADLLVQSVRPSELGAPVDRQLLALAAGAGGALLLAAIFGRFVADPGAGEWIFFDGPVSFAMSWSATLATPAGSLALALLAVDAVLASGVVVGSWARAVCVGQVVAAFLAGLPAVVVVGLAVVTVAVYVLLVCLALALVLVFLGS